MTFYHQGEFDAYILLCFHMYIIIFAFSAFDTVGVGSRNDIQPVTTEGWRCAGSTDLTAARYI